jgi:predicted dithiol-disulfide oxidoreductase (DUF899 family)
MEQTLTAKPPVATRDEWRTQRLELLKEEKELTKHKDRVNAMRRRLPMVKIEKDYMFDTTEGQKSLRELFGDKRQLIIYHFMFGPDWEKGCSGCTSYVDEIGDQSLLGKRDTEFWLVSRAPLEKLEAYGSDFNYDFHVTLDEKVAPIEYNYKSKQEVEATGIPYFAEGEEHGTSVFFRDGDDVYHTYSNYARGTEGTTDTYGLLDLTPYGRQEEFEDSPEGWPQKPTYG